MPRRKPAVRYTPRHHYTHEELLAAEIMDLETDIRCAIRDGQPEYAKEQTEKLAQLRRKLETESGSLGAPRRGAPLPQGTSLQAQRYLWDLHKPGELTMLGPTPHERYFLLKKTGTDLYFLGEVDVNMQPVSEYGRQGTSTQIGPDIDYVLTYGRLPS